jgi:hypothetical protein
MRFPKRLLLSIYVLLEASSSACSVPVFRYALEHWPADPFQVILFHRGTLSGELVDGLIALEKKDGLHPNLLVRRVDLDQSPTPELMRLLEQEPDAKPPWIIARFPSSSGIRLPVHSGPATAETLQALTNSVARQDIARRLGEGESAVWLLLESGNKAADDAAEKLLQERLDYLSSVMTLPKLDESDIANGLVSVPEEDLRLDFSIRRVSRTDPQEKVLVAMLLHSEEGLQELRGEPMVFPIFGRGRALYALVGAGIRSETIEAAAAFLIGKCSCQVKEQNPGVDLLITADWDAASKASPVLDHDLPTLADLIPPQPETVTTKAASPSLEQPQDQRLWLYAATILVLVVFAGLTLRLSRR